MSRKEPKIAAGVALAAVRPRRPPQDHHLQTRCLLVEPVRGRLSALGGAREHQGTGRLDRNHPQPELQTQRAVRVGHLLLRSFRQAGKGKAGFGKGVSNFSKEIPMTMYRTTPARPSGSECDRGAERRVSQARVPRCATRASLSRAACMSPAHLWRPVTASWPRR